MRVVMRNFENPHTGYVRKFLILRCDTEHESKMLDEVFGDKVATDDRVGRILRASCHLSDGYGEHYIRIERTPRGDK